MSPVCSLLSTFASLLSTLYSRLSTLDSLLSTLSCLGSSLYSLLPTPYSLLPTRHSLLPRPYALLLTPNPLLLTPYFRRALESDGVSHQTASAAFTRQTFPSPQSPPENGGRRCHAARRLQLNNKIAKSCDICLTGVRHGDLAQHIGHLRPLSADPRGSSSYWSLRR